MASIDNRSHRRSKSFSSSDTFSDDSTVTTATPPTPIRYLGVPFSWEKLPGIPKKNSPKNSDSSHNLLPLPPSATTAHHSPTMKKYSSSRSFRKDPFFAAFMECSREKELDIGGFSKSSKYPNGDRYGFVVSMYSSCKRTCAVSESIVHRRRSSAGYY